jgi:NADPH-dependent F420 reductase
MRIAVLGGTGPAGRALAVRLAATGFEVVIGSRDEKRASGICDEINASWPDHALGLVGTDNEAAAAADLVVMGTPWEAAAATTRSLAGQLAGKPVLSMANALSRIDGEFQALLPPRGSMAASVQAAAPDAKVVAACHHLAARELGDLTHRLDVDVLVASDHRDAMEVVSGVLEQIEGVRVLDCGSLVSAGPIESFTAVLLQLNSRYKARASVKITGIPS